MYLKLVYSTRRTKQTRQNTQNSDAWCKINDAWCMMPDASCMMQDAWCMIHDARCMMYHAWPMTHDGTPIAEVNQAIWLGRLYKDWSDNTETHRITDLKIRTSSSPSSSQKSLHLKLCIFLFWGWSTLPPYGPFPLLIF